MYSNQSKVCLFWPLDNHEHHSVTITGVLKEHTIYHMCHEPQLWTTTRANPNSVTYLRLFKLRVLDAQQEVMCFQHKNFVRLILNSCLNRLSRYSSFFRALGCRTTGLLNVGWVRRVHLRGSDGRESTQGGRPLWKGRRWWGWVIAVFQTAAESIHNTDLQCGKKEVKYNNEKCKMVEMQLISSYGAIFLIFK